MSIADAIACFEGVDFGQPDVRGVAPATFLHVDVAGGVITVLGPPSRRGETAAIGQWMA